MTSMLSDHEPYVTAANVRSRFDPHRLMVGPGIGRQGDIVIGDVLPRADLPITILDQALKPHRAMTPTRVVAPLGTRESSTHVNGGIPAEGLDVHDGRDARWLAGESGLVGLLHAEGRPTTSIGAETSTPFRCLGLVLRPSGQPLNVADLALEPSRDLVDVPILAVGATAAEAGKTVLTAALLSRLVGQGLRVAAVKATGTGGTMDSSRHREAGAQIVLDQVDGGLITTYGDPDTFRRRIVVPFRQARDEGADIIVAELGGDLVWANNPTLLSMPELVANIEALLVIGSDALSCAGISRYLDSHLGFPSDRVHLFSSPFRNHLGQLKRMPVLGIERLLDPNDGTALDAIVASLMSGVGRGQVSKADRRAPPRHR